MERVGAATFQVLVELQQVAAWRVHLSVEASVDRLLEGREPATQLRSWDAAAVTAAAAAARGLGGDDDGAAAAAVKVLVEFATGAAEAQALALAQEAGDTVDRLLREQQLKRQGGGGGNKRARGGDDDDGGQLLPSPRRQRYIV